MIFSKLITWWRRDWVDTGKTRWRVITVSPDHYVRVQYEVEETDLGTGDWRWRVEPFSRYGREVRTTMVMLRKGACCDDILTERDVFPLPTAPAPAPPTTPLANTRDLVGCWALCDRGRLGIITEERAGRWHGTALEGTAWSSKNPRLLCGSHGDILTDVVAALGADREELQ